MRLSSTIFTLLLSSSTLIAQTARPSAQFTLPTPPAAESCPVKLTVDRNPQGAVIYAGDLRDFAQRHANLSLEQQQRALQSEPGFHDLSPQQQQNRLDQLAELYNPDPAHTTQGLTVTIGKPGAAIVAADIVVRGPALATHIVPANNSAPPEVTQTFHLTARAGYPSINSPIWITRMAMISSIQLTRVQYADGSVWQPTAASRCSTTPSLFVLVNATAR